MTTEPEQLDLVIAANRQKLIDFFDQGAPHYRFDMGSGLKVDVYHSAEIPTTCGTAGCIAGAAFTMWLQSIEPEKRKRTVHQAAISADWSLDEDDTVEYDWDLILNGALEFLGLEKVSEDHCGHPLFNFALGYKATASDAAAALRRTFAGQDPWPQPHG
jgi:hypothetical protein